MYSGNYDIQWQWFFETYLSSLLVLYLFYSFRTSVMDMSWFSENIWRWNSVPNSGGRTSAIASLGSDLNYTQVYRSIKQHSATAILIVCCHDTLFQHHSDSDPQNEYGNIRKQQYCTLPLFILSTVKPVDKWLIAILRAATPISICVSIFSFTSKTYTHLYTHTVLGM